MADAGRTGALEGGVPAPDRRSGLLFNLVLGLLAGALVAAALAGPGRDPVVVRGAAGAGEDARSSGPVAGGDERPATAAGTDSPTAPTPGGDGGNGDVATASRGGGAARETADTEGSRGGERTGGAGATPTPSGEASTARGVTEHAVRIGVAVPDLGALEHLGPEFDNGDPREQWEAMHERWRREGLVPIHGRDLDLVYRDFDVIDPGSQRAACSGFVRDDEVFLVVGITYFHQGSECVAREHRTPLLTSDGVPDGAYERGHPFLFSIGMSNNRVVRNMVHMGHHEGILPGRTIGVYYEDTVDQRRLAEDDVEGELGRLGYEVAARHSTDQPLGGPQDAVAVQKFRAAGVDLAILLTSKAGFMQQAEAQGYRPTYLESDHDFGTSDTATERYPAEQFDGTYAITGRRDGELNAGWALTDDRRDCLDGYERHSGERPEQGSAEWAYVLVGCDLGKVLLHGLDAAGRDLTDASIVAGWEAIDGADLTRYLPASFEPDRHHGGERWRKLQWHADCTCWHVAGEVRPLFVP